MTLRLAVLGLRHGHINCLMADAKTRDAVEIVAVCEEDGPTRTALAENGIAVTHDSADALFADGGFDAVAVGDYYAIRGARVRAALEAGKAVIADKPICTGLDELDAIESLSREKALPVGCMLDNRDLGVFRTLREIVRRGTIGRVIAASIGGQHPLSRGSRPEWYFEKGKHGGTLNDIAIHAIDLFPWLTGDNWDSVQAARCWNGRVADAPHFEECGQAMLTTESGAGVQIDVSYLAPDSFGYGLPYYWRYTLWGEEGVLETSMTTDGIVLHRNGKTESETLPLGESRPGGYLDAFLKAVAGDAPEEDGLTTDAVFRASRATLQIQAAADKGPGGVKL